MTHPNGEDGESGEEEFSCRSQGQADELSWR